MDDVFEKWGREPRKGVNIAEAADYLRGVRYELIRSGNVWS